MLALLFLLLAVALGLTLWSSYRKAVLTIFAASLVLAILEFIPHLTKVTSIQL